MYVHIQQKTNPYVARGWEAFWGMTHSRWTAGELSGSPVFRAHIFFLSKLKVFFRLAGHCVMQ